MSNLDVSPMITALQNTPSQFEFVCGWLNHVPSGHSFRFHENEQVEVSAACNCALLVPTREGERELSKGFREWERVYWQPLLINRQFASHFYKSGPRRLLIVLTERLHRWLLGPPRVNRSAAAARTS
jgi:hypothetical protein